MQGGSAVGGMLPWPASDPSVERQARYVSAVVARARRADAKRLQRMQMEKAYLSELHRVAPTASSTSVVDPGLQTAHGWVAVGLNCPASQTVQRVAPDFPSVSVTDPGGHAVHRTVGSALYWPATHTVHVLLPGSA